MSPSPDLKQIHDHILKIKDLLITLESMAPDYPALSRNSRRALACIKMMELNFCDPAALEPADTDAA